MIDLASVVTLASAAELEANADGISRRADDVKATADSCKSWWAGMSGVYSAPEQETVHGAMDSVVTIAARVVTGAVATASALRTYALELAMLATRRSVLIDDIVRHNTTLHYCLADPVDEAERVESARIAASALVTRVDAFNAAAQRSDADCASALGRISTQAVAPFPSTASSFAGGAALGLGTDLLKRYRSYLVAGPTSQGPTDLRLDDADTEVIDGKTWARSPGGFLVRPGALRVLDPHGETFTGLEKRGLFTVNPDIGTPPAWMKTGGKALGVVGAGLTVWGSYSDKYNSDQAGHPEWSESRRVQSAATNAVIVGGASVGGAWAGAAGGAKLGAVVGTFFGPGPGTLIGGIVGGLVGGAAGGFFGAELSDGVKTKWEESFG